MGAAREPEDIAKAMRRIEDEAARMGVLVEDLLTLARLDEVREAPHGTVDLAVLARDAVDDARATAPDREIALRRAAGPPSSGDADQLRQVLANLLRNALVHTPAGTPIEVSVAARRRSRPARGPRPRAGPADRRRRRAVRALLARRGRARARQGRRRARPGDRRRDRRRPPRQRSRPPTPPAAARPSRSAFRPPPTRRPESRVAGSCFMTIARHNGLPLACRPTSASRFRDRAFRRD